MQTDSAEFAGLWYVLTRDLSVGLARWRDDDEAEEWLQSAGAPDGLSIMHELPYSFTMFAPRSVVAGLSESLASYARRRSDADDFSEFAADLAMDLPHMRASPEGEPFSAGVHPWSFSEGTVWEFWSLPREQAVYVIEAVRGDPRLSDPLVGCYDDYMPLGGDVHTARMLVDALDAQEAIGEMLETRESLRRWIEWIEGLSEVPPLEVS